MPTFEVTSPDGKTFEVNAPEGATQDQALEYAKQQFSQPSGMNRGLGLGLRAVGPVGAGMAVGALAGAPIGGVGALPGAVAGGAAMGVTQLLDSLLGTNYVQALMTKMGLPEPNTPTERVIQDVAGGMAQVPGAAQAGRILVSSGKPVAEAIGRTLMERLGAQTAAAGAASGGAGVTREAGGGPLAQAAVGTATALTPAGIRGAIGGTRNAVTGRINQAFETPYAQEGLANEAQTGMTMTPGQITGNPGLMLAENAARQSFFTRSKVLKMDQQVAMKAIEHVTNLADEISANQYSPGAMGETLQNALSGTVKKIDGLRDQSAKLDYGEVRRLGGDQPIITYGKTAEELQKIIGEYANVAGADAEKIAAQSKRMLDRVTGPQEAPLPTNAQEYQAYLKAQGQIVPKTVTVDEALRTRRFYSKASAGSGNVFDDVAPNLNRELASRLAKAADADFQVNGNGPAYDALKVANRNYADHTRSIEYVQTSILGKLLGKDVADAALSGAVGNTIAGETVAKKMLSMQPSEAETVSNILAQHAPNILVDTKSYIIRNALANGMDIKASAGANTIPISYAKFIDHLPKTDYMRAMRFSAGEMSDIRNTINAMERVGDRTGYNQSQTAVISGFYNDLKSLASFSVRGGLSVVGQAAGLNKIAQAMASPEGREALRTIVTPRKSESQVANALSVLNSQKWNFPETDEQRQTRHSAYDSMSLQQRKMVEDANSMIPPAYGAR